MCPRRQLGRALQRALFALMAVVLVFGALQSGTRYAYCSAMRELLTAPCCAGERQPADADQGHDDARGISRPDPDCCHALTLDVLPHGAASQPPVVAEASFVSVAPDLRLSIVFDAQAFRSLPRVRKDDAPPRPSAARSRARLSVFLV